MNLVLRTARKKVHICADFGKYELGADKPIEGCLKDIQVGEKYYDSDERKESGIWSTYKFCLACGNRIQALTAAREVKP